MSRIDRRSFIRGSALMGCSVAAHPLLTTMSLASAPTENRLVVMVLRGAMDGLDVVQPFGDADFARLRPTLAALPGQGARDLDGFFALNEAFAPLMPLWQSGQLAFAHAASTPYRDGRSHFDGQDLLEAGTSPEITGALARQGWLNRMLQVVPGMQTSTAFAVGRDRMRILSGAAPVLNWAPATRLELTEASRVLLTEVFHEDPLFMQTAEEAMNLAQSLDVNRSGGDSGGGYAAGMQAIKQMTDGSKTDGDADVLARFAAERLMEETRIAAFSINGWDTHRAQARSMRRQADKLSGAILALRDGLGPVWQKTTVIAVTEFGRTARENGSQGTDHGTGGVVVLAGGALSGAKVHGRWPGLGESALLDGRDLMPTADVREYAGWAMRGLFGISAGDIETTVFPGLKMGSDPRLLA